MPGILNLFFKILAVAGAVVIIWRVALLFWRVKYAEAIVASTPEQRLRIMDAYRARLLIMRLSLWLLPMISVAFPLGLYFFTPEVGPWVVFAAMVELTFVVAMEYSFEKWLIRYVAEHEKAPPSSNKS